MTDVIVRILHFWKDEMLPVSSFGSESGHFKFSKYASMSIKQNDRFFLENVFEMLRKPGQWYLDKAEGILYVIPNDGDSPAEYTVYGSTLETMISVDGANGISFENIIFRGNGFSYSVERDFLRPPMTQRRAYPMKRPQFQYQKLRIQGYRRLLRIPR